VYIMIMNRVGRFEVVNKRNRLGAEECNEDCCLLALVLACLKLLLEQRVKGSMTMGSFSLLNFFDMGMYVKYQKAEEASAVVTRSFRRALLHPNNTVEQQVPQNPNPRGLPSIILPRSCQITRFDTTGNLVTARNFSCYDESYMTRS